MLHGHVSNEALELYSLGRLREPELGALEEHLLLCTDCQERVEREDELTRVTRRALEAVAAERGLESHPHRWFWPRIAWAAGLALAAVALVMVAVMKPSAENVQLIAQRGSEAAAIPIHSGAPLNLTIDATELPALPEYEVEVVDATGRVLATRAVKPERSVMKARVPGLSSGTYWVRLYNGASHDLLREFSLAVK